MIYDVPVAKSKPIPVRIAEEIIPQNNTCYFQALRMKILLLLAVLIAATIQTTAQNPAPTRPGANATGFGKETPMQKELRLKQDAARAAFAAARTAEERRRIWQQIEDLSKLKDIANRVADDAKTVAGQLEMARMNAESERRRAELRARVVAHGDVKLAEAAARATPAASPEPATTAAEPTPVQARHWSDGIPLPIYVAIGCLGFAWIVIWILFPPIVYLYLRKLVVAQEQMNKLLIIQLEQTRQSSPPTTARVDAGTDQQVADHPSGEDSAIFTTEF
jgi:hypothetical protein